MTRAGVAFASAVGAVAAVGFVVGVATWWIGDDDVDVDARPAVDSVFSDPTSVATVVMAGISSWQPTVQDSTWEALYSQRSFLTGPMASAAAVPPEPADPPIAE